MEIRIAAVFGATLKYAGYDMVIIEGQAKEPGLPVDR